MPEGGQTVAGLNKIASFSEESRIRKMLLSNQGDWNRSSTHRHHKAHHGRDLVGPL